MYLVSALIWFILYTLSSLFSINFMVGSHFSFFSAANIIVPASALISGPFVALSLFILRFVGFSLLGTYSLTFLLCNTIPGFFASLFWSMPLWFSSLLMPVLCTILFLSHPVGFASWQYVLLWTIPTFFYLLTLNNRSIQALQATFLAHMVGSVLWLYTIPMSSEQWLALIPIVLVERFVFATGIVIVSYLYQRCYLFFDAWSKKTHSPYAYARKESEKDIA